MPPYQPLFNQINLVVQDMEATVAFYRRLGLTFEVEVGEPHVNIALPNGLRLEFDTVEFAKQWDSGWKGFTGGGAVLGFSVPSREAVDEIYADLTSAGYRGHQLPYDAFWGARYAMVEDPDGNSVGLMSPIDQQRKFWPPQTPPSSQES